MRKLLVFTTKKFPIWLLRSIPKTESWRNAIPTERLFCSCSIFGNRIQISKNWFSVKDWPALPPSSCRWKESGSTTTKPYSKKLVAALPPGMLISTTGRLPRTTLSLPGSPSSRPRWTWGLWNSVQAVIASPRAVTWPFQTIAKPRLASD